MGLLDDAIREHLDLKRRHGGDPTEIARMEREALGPVRRGPEPLDAPYHRRRGDAGCDQHARALVGAQATQLYDAVIDDGQAPEREPRIAAAAVMQPTAEYDVFGEYNVVATGVVGARAGIGVHRGADDVVHKTPDFLEPAPEHDRLWFEQKPPQEYDF